MPLYQLSPYLFKMQLKSSCRYSICVSYVRTWTNKQKYKTYLQNEFQKYFILSNFVFRFKTNQLPILSTPPPPLRQSIFSKNHHHHLQICYNSPMLPHIKRYRSIYSKFPLFGRITYSSRLPKTKNTHKWNQIYT